MERAEGARATAEELSDPTARRAMLDIAEGYEITAKRLGLPQRPEGKTGWASEKARMNGGDAW